MKKVALSAAVCAMAFSANADVVETSAFNSIYGGLGIGGSFFETKVNGCFFKNKDGKDLGKAKAHRVIGSVVLGGGKVFSNNVYAGGEFLFDFAKEKKTKFFHEEAHVVDGIIKGIVPQISAKVGYVLKNDALVYGKVGCAWSKISLRSVAEKKTNSKNKASFVLGLGAEKAFCKKFSTAVEGEYNFGFKWQDKNVTEDQKLNCNRGWNVRALVKYNVKY